MAFRSKLESRVGEWIKPFGGTYESHKMPYVIQKNYTPDFTLEDYRIHVEVKGWFRAGDRQKYKAIKEAMDQQEWDFVFILQNPGKAVSKGAKSTMSDWCDKHNIIWYAAYDANGFEQYLEYLESQGEQ